MQLIYWAGFLRISDCICTQTQAPHEHEKPTNWWLSIWSMVWKIINYEAESINGWNFPVQFSLISVDHKHNLEADCSKHQRWQFQLFKDWAWYIHVLVLQKKSSGKHYETDSGFCAVANIVSSVHLKPFYQCCQQGTMRETILPFSGTHISSSDLSLAQGWFLFCRQSMGNVWLFHICDSFDIKDKIWCKRAHNLSNAMCLHELGGAMELSDLVLLKKSVDLNCPKGLGQCQMEIMAILPLQNDLRDTWCFLS